MSQNAPMGLLILGGCNPKTITVDGHLVTLVQVVSIGPTGNQGWIGKMGWIQFNGSQGQYHFMNQDTSDPNFISVPLTPCSFIQNTCTTQAITIQIAVKRQGTTTVYNLTFSIGQQFFYLKTGNLSGTSSDWVTQAPTGCSPPVPCIGNGQQILTPNGYKLIEELATGDLITTSDNKNVPITIEQCFVPIVTDCNCPILIPANTFGPESPPYDIVLSPNHYLMVRPGVWDVPARLINYYPAITKIESFMGQQYIYYCISTPNYLTDNVVANGTIVESHGQNFADKYPGAREYYIFDETINGCTRITLQSVIESMGIVH